MLRMRSVSCRCAVYDDRYVRCVVGAVGRLRAVRLVRARARARLRYGLRQICMQFDIDTVCYADSLRDARSRADAVRPVAFVRLDSYDMLARARWR